MDPGTVRAVHGPDLRAFTEGGIMRRRAVVAVLGLLAAGLLLLGWGVGAAQPVGSGGDPQLHMVIDCWGVGGT